MANIVDFTFNIGGNFTTQINGMSQATGNFSANIKTAQSQIDGFSTALAKFDLIKSAVHG